MSLRFAQSSRRLKIRALEEVKEIKTPVQNLVTILHHLLVQVAHLPLKIKVVREIEVLNRHEARRLKIPDARKIDHPSLDSLLHHHHRTQVVPATGRQIQLEAHHHKTVA